MKKSFLFGQMRDIVESWEEDTGGMFDWRFGVIKSDKGYHAFVETGWGGGGMSKAHVDQATARQDIDRLRNKV